jgi:Zeta toxin/Type III restriction enzyme, res subunit/Helicase conserved C-terminal domain
MERDIETDVIEPEEKEFSIIGGDFFRENPHKLLAQEQEASGRFGKVKVYKPKEGLTASDALKEIETPEFIAGGITDKSAGASVILTKDPVITPDIADNIDLAISETEKSIIKKQRSEKRKLQAFDEPSAKPTLPFEDVLRHYNKNLTDDEIKAFLWYMHQSGNTYRGKWLNVFNPELLSQEQESAFIQSWVKKGILFYFEGSLLPDYKYFSENLYERKSQLASDKEDIIKIYGQEAYNQQESKLEQVFTEAYNNRLKLDDPNVERRLHLKPYGDFAKEIKIRNWNIDNNTGESSPFYLIISGAAKTSGDINWYSKQTHVSSYKGSGEDELSIADAFRYWLKHDTNRPQLPYNYTYEDIFRYYLDKKAVKDMEPTVLARHRALTKEVGDKFFSKFLAEVILENDRVKIETVWNERFNGTRGLRTEKIPIAFECALNYPADEPVEIRPEKREAVAFASIRGSSLNAYQVGVGKTWAAILTMAQFLDAGHCKRPFLVVPNQVYKQFMSEMKGILPHRKINDLYNLSRDYIETLQDERGNMMPVDEGSISMLTYEGFERIGFNNDTQRELLSQLEEALTQIQDISAYNESKAAEKEAVRKQEKLKGMIGKALQKTETNIEDLGFDFVCFDEAHALKNIFSQVKAKAGEKGEEEEKAKRGKKMYEIQGSSSTRGIKAYCLCSYIQLMNRGRNVMLLTATPFTNSPLEVYSMLSLVAYQYLKTIGLSNINDFFDNYCQMSYELVIDSRLQPIRKQVFKAFDNLLSLQKLVYSFMLHKEAGKADENGNIIALVRPDKWLLPYKGRYNEKNEFIPAKPEEYIDTVLPLTEEQKLMMDDIIAYAEGKISYDSLSARGMTIVEEGEEEPEGDAEIFHIDENFMKDDEKAGVRVLRGVNFARSLALSPYLYEFAGIGEPTYMSYIERSPKLKYIMECVRSVKKWHEDRKEAVSGQVIYMDRGKKYFELIKDYLVKEIGYQDHEIGIIRSGKEGTSKHKDMVKNLYNGLEFNEATKLFVDIPDEKRIKVIIGTSSIREGLNLQRYGTVLYNAFVDWNPTDEIQLEGRVWRQGNSFKNCRIVLPMMSDSMDIFMFQKLEEKTERINSIWNYDGKSNVLKVEELDPKEQKMALVTDPKVIAELEVEGDIAKMDEDAAEVENNMQIAENIIGFYGRRDELQTELLKVLQIIEPDKKYTSIDVMMRDFESALTSGKNSKGELCKTLIEAAVPSQYDRHNYHYIQSYSATLTKSYSYGNGKGAVNMLKKAKKSFLERFSIPDNKEALEHYINEQKRIKDRIHEDKESLSSAEHISQRAVEIEEERKQRQIRFASVEERVSEFEKLNYLLGIKRDKEFVSAEEFMWEEVEGCPPLDSNEKRDTSPEGIKRLEACIERIPQTKDLNTDETGNYTENRQKLHKIIKGKLRVGMVCKLSHEKPVAILTGGPPASGKTTFLKGYAPNLTKEKLFKIDADEIREMLPDYKGWNASATHKETQDIYRSLLQDISEGKPCKFDILWDGTMNKAENYLPLIGDLRKLGYSIYMIFVTVSWEESRAGVIERYGRTGRYVPMAVVDEANTAGLKVFETLKTKADGYMIVKGGRNPEILEKYGEDILADRGYFDKKPTEKDVSVIKAKAKAIAMKMRIRILKLKEE